jgi:uncharacterized membrane protein YdjX (TVP38/TMEM64 family)
MQSRAPWRGLVVIVLLALTGAAIYFSPLGSRLDAGALLLAARKYSGTWWIIPAYFVAYALLDVLFIPTQFLSIAAVLLWGWARGGTIELIAATAGAIPPFLIARGALREWFAERIRPHRRAADMIDREGFTLLLLLRVVPIIPYTPLNYVAGVSSVPLARYVLATFIGVMPSTFIFAWFVQAVVDGVMQPRDVMLRALGAGALLAALIIATRLAAPAVRKRMSPEGRTASPPDDAHRGSDSPARPPE